jgi:hypothetical protein
VRDMERYVPLLWWQRIMVNHKKNPRLEQ